MGFRVLVFLAFLVAVVSCGNDTAPDREAKDTYRPIGTLASVGRMFIDIPLGFVEALKDVKRMLEVERLSLRMNNIFTNRVQDCLNDWLSFYVGYWPPKQLKVLL